MYSNKVLNFQESTTILNAQYGNLLYARVFCTTISRSFFLESEWQQISLGPLKSFLYFCRSYQRCGINSLDSSSGL